VQLNFSLKVNGYVYILAVEYLFLWHSQFTGNMENDVFMYKGPKRSSKAPHRRVGERVCPTHAATETQVWHIVAPFNVQSDQFRKLEHRDILF